MAINHVFAGVATADYTRRWGGTSACSDRLIQFGEPLSPDRTVRGR